jgi:hypothetical protein
MAAPGKGVSRSRGWAADRGSAMILIVLRDDAAAARAPDPPAHLGLPLAPSPRGVVHEPARARRSRGRGRQLLLGQSSLRELAAAASPAGAYSGAPRAPGEPSSCTRHADRRPAPRPQRPRDDGDDGRAGAAAPGAPGPAGRARGAAARIQDRCQEVGAIARRYAPLRARQRPRATPAPTPRPPAAPQGPQQAQRAHRVPHARRQRLAQDLRPVLLRRPAGHPGARLGRPRTARPAAAAAPGRRSTRWVRAARRADPRPDRRPRRPPACRSSWTR